MEIIELMDLSTCHLAAQDVEAFRMLGGGFPMRVIAYELGWLVKVVDLEILADSEINMEKVFSKIFVKIYKKALELNCLWINFDFDAMPSLDFEIPGDPSWPPEDQG